MDKFRPKCMNTTTQMAVDNRGRLLPCCYIDTPKWIQFEEIKKLWDWVNDPATPKTENQRGERCVTVNQKLLPRTSKKGNPFLLGVTSGKKEEMPF